MINKANKVLFVASIDKHILKFHVPSIKILYDQGFEVDVACNGKIEIPYVRNYHQIDFIRSPFSFFNLFALFQLIRVLKTNDYFILHCHTAVASVIARIACILTHKRKVLKLIYTAHGFHFFKGSPIHYWLVYYPIEKILSFFTDCLITINMEDYLLAKNKFFCNKVCRISGMGVDSTLFKEMKYSEKSLIRRMIGVPDNSFVLIYAAEFINRKNHKFLLEIAFILKRHIPTLHIILPGRGVLWERLNESIYASGLGHFIHMVGYRNDIHKIIGCADIAISSSKQEGLGLHLVEAKMCGLPIIATDVRGHREVVHHDVDGFLYPKGDYRKFVQFVLVLYHDSCLRKSFSERALINSAKFDLSVSVSEMYNIYSEILDS